MAFQKQVKFKSGKKLSEEDINPKPRVMKNDGYFPTQVPNTKNTPFLEAWTNCRDRHPGQTAVLRAVFEDRCQYAFYRAGRKGAKTTTAIDSAWRFSHESPNRVVYLCYPTIAQGIEVVWEERRLQTCDQKDDHMFDRFVSKIDETRHIIRFNNGSFIKLIGTWTEAKGRGTQPDMLIFDEFQDCNADYIEAMDPNLAAKEHSQCLIMGTPPKKRNHYESWWDRIGSHPKGARFHYTSYDNIKLPHLKEWLDSKKIELINSGKEDVWQREYMAEFCYSSSDRILPDAKFQTKYEIDRQCRLFAHSERVPILAISVHEGYFCAVLAVLMPKKMIFVTDHVIYSEVWNQTYKQMYSSLGEKVKNLQDFCGRKMRVLVWDESDSFCDVITEAMKCRTDIKWQSRGLPLLRELMIKDKIVFCDDLALLDLECQNLLIDENRKEVERNYPLICTCAMMINEYFSQEKLSINQVVPFDKWQAFRDMGIPCPPKVRPKKLFNIGNYFA